MIKSHSPALFLVDKPSGPTSHDMVRKIRNWTGIKRVGHGGTLDPLASGLLPIAVNNATRLVEYISEHRKTYTAQIQLGVSTDTDDAQGNIIEKAQVPEISQMQMDSILETFRGKIQQTPPAYSAVKVNGLIAHHAARRGQPLEIQPRSVTVHRIDIDTWKSPNLFLTLIVSSGTYVRAIARDLGATLKCGGHIVSIRRTAIGPITIADAHSPSRIQNAFKNGNGWKLAISPSRIIEHWPKITLNNIQRSQILHGQSIDTSIHALTSTHMLAFDGEGGILAILVPEEITKGRWRPIKVLAKERD